MLWPAVGDLRGSGLSKAPVGRLAHLDVLLNVHVIRLRRTWLHLRDDQAIAGCQPEPEKGKFVINLLAEEEEKKRVILWSDGRQVPVLRQRQQQRGCCYFFEPLLLFLKEIPREERQRDQFKFIPFSGPLCKKDTNAEPEVVI